MALDAISDFDKLGGYMWAPLYQLGHIDDLGMIGVALVLGFFFGYLVENSGFANAKNFTAAFYGENWRVYKILFSAILTAMILTFLAFYLGFLDISLVQLSTVYLGAQIVGGIILGAGVVIGGYCPGTDVAAAMTRKKDAWVFMVGAFVGIVLYAEVYPFISRFVLAWNLGKMTLSDLLNVPYGVAAQIVIIVTVVSFFVLRGIRGRVYTTG